MICVCQSIRSALLLKRVHTLAAEKGQGREMLARGNVSEGEKRTICGLHMIAQTNPTNELLWLFLLRATGEFDVPTEGDWVSVCVCVSVFGFRESSAKVEVPCKFDCWLNYPENENEQNETSRK